MPRLYTSRGERNPADGVFGVWGRRAKHRRIEGVTGSGPSVPAGAARGQRGPSSDFDAVGVILEDADEDGTDDGREAEREEGVGRPPGRQVLARFHHGGA